MYSIGNVTCETENHAIINIIVRINNLKWLIGNYEEYQKEIDDLVSSTVYGGNSSALFRYEPDDQFAYYVPMENISKLATFVRNISHVKHYPRMDFERVADDARELVTEINP